jgi:hypothetical protein
MLGVFWTTLSFAVFFIWIRLLIVIFSFRGYVHVVASRGSAPADLLARLGCFKDRGALSGAEFEGEHTKILAA